MPTDPIQWVSDHPQLIAVTAIVSLVTFVGTLFVIPLLVVRMRADYFTATDLPGLFRNRHPLVRWTAIALKNLLGLGLVAMGLVMLVLPGQGLLSLLLGISLLDFPGKRRLERRIAMRRPVRRTLDWIRRRRGRPPLRFDGMAKDKD